MASRRPIHEGWLSVPGSFGCRQRVNSQPPRTRPAASSTAACPRLAARGARHARVHQHGRCRHGRQGSDPAADEGELLPHPTSGGREENRSEHRPRLGGEEDRQQRQCEYRREVHLVFAALFTSHRDAQRVRRGPGPSQASDVSRRRAGERGRCLTVRADVCPLCWSLRAGETVSCSARSRERPPATLRRVARARHVEHGPVCTPNHLTAAVDGGHHPPGMSRPAAEEPGPGQS